MNEPPVGFKLPEPRIRTLLNALIPGATIAGAEPLEVIKATKPCPEDLLVADPVSQLRRTCCRAIGRSWSSTASPNQQT